MPLTIGTSYFVSKMHALRYYDHEGATLNDIAIKEAEGLIHIGKPPIRPGDRLVLLDDGARYGIEESGQ